MGSRSAHRVFGSASTFQCPVLAEKTAAKPVGEIVCWKAGSGRSKAKVRSQPQREDVESSRMQGKGLGDWGKDAEGSPGRRLTKFSGHHQPCPPCAHQSASRTSAACSPILLRWPGQARKICVWGIVSQKPEPGFGEMASLF